MTMKMGMYLVGAAAFLTPVALLAQVPITQTPQPATASSPAMASANPAPFGTDSSANGGTATDPQLMKDKIFVHRATDGVYAEAQFGQLAVQKSANEDVKKLGQRILDDHTVLDAALKPIADSMGVRQPTKLGKGDQEELDKLKGMSGADFDKEYLTYVLKDHTKGLQAFEAESNDTNDPTLKETAAKGQAMIAKHLRWASRVAAANGVAVAAATQMPK